MGKRRKRCTLTGAEPSVSAPWRNQLAVSAALHRPAGDPTLPRIPERAIITSQPPGWGLIPGSCPRTDTRLTRVSGYAERLAALDRVQYVAEHPCATTLGADWGYDAADFVKELCSMNVRVHVAQNTSRRRSAIDKRTTRHPGYVKSQRVGKRIEEAFGWTKTVAGLRKTRLRELPKVDWAFTFAAAPDNLVRVPKLVGAA